MTWSEKELYRRMRDCKKATAISNHKSTGIELAGATETIEFLKQQLTEKDEQVGKLKYELEWAKQDLNECAAGLEQKYNQDKISFCIEQLENVKKEIDKRPLTVRNCGYGEFDEILLDDVYDVIDNQIKQLKEKSNDTD